MMQVTENRSKDLGSLVPSIFQEFATSDTPTRERLLPDLVEQINTNTVDDARMKSWAEEEFQEIFAQAIEATLNTVFTTWTGESIQPWEGGYTVSAVTLGGRIIGASSRPKGTLYEVLGRNLYPHTLWKCAYRIHLELSRKDGGLDSDDNSLYLLSLLPKKRIYKGEAFLQWSNPIGNIVIGGSACELSKEYKNSLAPGMIREGKEAMNFLAGHAEMTFAHLLAFHLNEPTASTTLKEPTFFSLLRRSH